MSSLLDLAPRDHTARGAGSNTEPAWVAPEPLFTAAGCPRPIRLTGSLAAVEPGTGRVVDERHTDQLPDAAIYKACGNRRATVCPSCARTYQRDAYQLLRAGLIGGKGIF